MTLKRQNMQTDTVKNKAGGAVSNIPDLEGISVIFGVLGKFFYSYPEYETYNKAVIEGIFAEPPVNFETPEFEEGRKILENWATKGFDRKEFDSITADYIRLFIGGGDSVLCPPWESVYVSTDPMIFQPSTLDVRKHYAKNGLQVEKLHNEPDDHIGLELIFLSALIAKVSQGGQTDSDEMKDFFALHLSPWVTHFCSIMGKAAKNDFFKGLAKITEGAVKGFGDMIGVKVTPNVYR